MRPQEYSILNRDLKDFAGPVNLKLRLLSALHGLAYPPMPKLLDMSRYQLNDTINPKEIKAAGYVGVILQATYGVYVDVGFSHFWRMFLDEGFIIMTYHLFWATLNGVDQAHKHLETIAPLWQAADAKWPAWNDIEVRDGVPIPTRQARAEDWRREIRKETTPGTYCSYSLWNELMGGISLGDQLGWQAAWNPYYDFIPCRNWKLELIKLRQNGVARKHDWVDIVPGCSGDVDVNEFRGTLEELYQLAGETPPELPPPPEDNMSALEKLKAARDKLVVLDGELDSAIVTLNAGIEELEAGSPPAPTPTPGPQPSPNTVRMRVKADPHCKVWCFQVWNAEKGKLIEKRNSVEPVGQPIMQEYFDDDDKRTTFNKGLVLTFLVNVVNADGPIDFMELADTRGDHNVRLFVKRIDLGKLE